MRKTLTDLAKYLKCILVPETRKAYSIQPVFAEIGSADTIREGILAFRAFLCKLYDVLAVEGQAYDTSKKIAHAYENRTGLSVYYPFLHNVNVMLRSIGYHGALEENQGALICGNTIFSEKLSVSKTRMYGLSSGLWSLPGRPGAKAYKAKPAGQQKHTGQLSRKSGHVGGSKGLGHRRDGFSQPCESGRSFAVRLQGFDAR